MTRYVFDPAPQGTPEWLKARAGKATASMASCVTAKTRDGKSEGTTRRDYRVQLVTERLTGEPQEEGFTSKWMQDGKENEPWARMAYESATGNMVREAGFAFWRDLLIGCSPDGLVDDPEDGFGIVQIKCPKPAIHIGYLTACRLPPEHGPQVGHEGLVIDDANFVDFVSFCPKLPENLRFFRVRVYREELGIKVYEPELMKFLAEVDALEAQLRKRAA